MNDARLKDAYHSLNAGERAVISIRRFKEGEEGDEDLRRTAPPYQVDEMNQALALFNHCHQHVGWFSLLQEERLEATAQRLAFLTALAAVHRLAEDTLGYLRGEPEQPTRESLIQFAERLRAMTDVTVDGSLAFDALARVCGDLAVVHEELLAAEVVVEERSELLSGEEPLHPETRQRLDAVAQTIPALAARARHHGLEPVLPDAPADPVVAFLRRLTEATPW